MRAQQDRNLFNLSEYIWYNCIFSGGLLSWFHNIYFRPIPGMGTETTKIFWVIILGGLLLGLFITGWEDRNGLNIFVNALFPWCIYVCLVFLPFYSPIRVACIVAGILSLFYMSMVFVRRIKRRRKRGLIILRRVRQALLGARNIVTCILMAVVMLPLGIILIKNGGKTNKEVQVTKNMSICMEQYTISNYEDELMDLQEEEWKGLDKKKRLKLMETVANIEANALGLSVELVVESRDLKGERLGQYFHQDALIEIDEECLLSQTSSVVLGIIAHEVHHAYQNYLSNAYSEIENSLSTASKKLIGFRRMEEYRAEFEDYVTADEDAIGYETQAVETDADMYSLVVVEKYSDWLEEKCGK